MRPLRDSDGPTSSKPASLPAPGNPSSVHGPGRAPGRPSNGPGRGRDALHADPAGVVFTSSGTEADNLAVRGGAHAARGGGRREVLFGGRAPPSGEPALALAPEGFVPRELPVNDGVPRTAERARPCARLRDPREHETGAVFEELPAFAAAARAAGTLVLSDAVQAAGRYGWTPQRSASISSHHGTQVRGPGAGLCGCGPAMRVALTAGGGQSGPARRDRERRGDRRVGEGPASHTAGSRRARGSRPCATGSRRA